MCLTRCTTAGGNTPSYRLAEDAVVRLDGPLGGVGRTGTAPRWATITTDAER